MDKIVNFSDYSRKKESTIDYYEASNELMSFISRLSLTKEERETLTGLLLNQNVAIVDLMLSQIKKQSDTNGGDFSFKIDSPDFRAFVVQRFT